MPTSLHIHPVLCLLVAAALSGCAITGKPSPTRTTASDFPPIGQRIKAEVGASLIVQENVVEREGILFLSDTRYSCESPTPYEIQKGTFFEKRISSDSSYAYCGAAPMTALMGNRVVHQFCLRRRASGSWGHTGSMSGCGSELPVKEGWHSVIHPDNFQRKLVYNGKSGNSLFISYREFVSDMARPAFTQDLTFDLAESDVFGFQGARIKVYQATNTQIDYELLKNFPDREAN
jgi:hypothetical protein